MLYLTSKAKVTKDRERVKKITHNQGLEYRERSKLRSGGFDKVL